MRRKASVKMVVAGVVEDEGFDDGGCLREVEWKFYTTQLLGVDRRPAVGHYVVYRCWWGPGSSDASGRRSYAPRHPRVLGYFNSRLQLVCVSLAWLMK